MEFELKPDYEKTQERFDAFFEREIVDRPPVTIPLWKEGAVLPEKEYASQRDRWLDIDFRVEYDVKRMEGTEWFADAIPVAWPNMGPEIFSAWMGCGYEFGETTTWSTPAITGWDEPYHVQFDPGHPLFRAVDRYTDMLIERGRGRFIVGLTDFHSGGDHVAALRDPQELAIDMLENEDRVKEELRKGAEAFFPLYDYFYDKIAAAGMPASTWTPISYRGKFYVPSNDFSCMVSTDMFERVFLPGIIEECRHYDRSIYHLDGPGALRHLDVLLDIPELNAIQWVPGANNEEFCRWIDVCQRIQQGGKALEITAIDASELPLAFENLKREGVWFGNITGIQNREHAEYVLRRIERWQ